MGESGGRGWEGEMKREDRVRERGSEKERCLMWAGHLDTAQ